MIQKNMINKSKRSYSSKKYILLIIFAIIMFILLPMQSVTAIIYNNLPVSTISDEFPASYKPYIDALKQARPNWVFKAVNTNIDWNLAIQHETYQAGALGISTVHQSLGDAWKKDGQNHYIDGPYVVASIQAVEYVMDPRNFLTERDIFQFETLTYSDTTTISAIEKALGNTPMANQYKNQYKNDNVWITMDKTYAQIIKEIGQKHNVSPTHIASRIIQETSGDIVNKPAINGSRQGYEGLYNFMNVGAKPNSDGSGAVENGLKYARDNGWTDPTKSIDGCTNVLRNSYIRWGQDTIYFQKFDVNNPYGNAVALFAYQYMTNIMAPSNESKIMHSAYVNSGMINEAFEFHIPVYKNMPASAVPLPTIDSYYEPDDTWVYLDDGIVNGTDAFNVRLTADSSSSNNIITVIRETKEGAENRTKFKRILRGVHTGWDKILLPDGREGFVASQFVRVYQYTKVSSVSLSNTTLNLAVNETRKLNFTINPTNAKFKNVSWATSDSSVVTVDQSGNITAKKLGTATITVTTEDQNKTATCVVNVQSTNVDSISLTNTEYKVVKDNSITITPIILPTTATNKDFSVTIENEEIAKFVDGKIQGLAVGETNVTFTTVDGNKTAVCLVKVVELGEGEKVLFDDSLDVKDNNITRINPSTKVSNLIPKITTVQGLTVEVRNSSNKVLTNTDNIGTGTKINIKDDAGNVVDTYETIIYGDLSGDGIIDSLDILILRRHLLNVNNLQGSFLKAANISRNSENIVDSLDILILRRHLLNVQPIVQ